MKLLRVGQKGNEKPAILDKDGKIRDISSHMTDLNPDNLNFEIISKLRNADLSSLPELSSSERIGSCVAKPGKFIAIGLNYSDHAAETGAEVPSEPIMFMKATSCIAGKYLQGVPEESRANQDKSLDRQKLTPELVENLKALNELASGRGQTLAHLIFTAMEESGSFLPDIDE